MKKWIFSALLLSFCAGCAQQGESLVSLAALREGEAAVAADRSAVVWRHRLAANQKYMARYPTIATVQGEGLTAQKYHDFHVIFGLPAGLEPLDIQQEDLTQAESRFKNPEPSWEIVTGYGYLWGWWPIGYTPFVRVGSEGRAAFLLFVESATHHRVVLLSGEKATIKVRDELGDGTRELASPNFVVDVKADGGAIELSAPYELPADDRLVPVIEKLQLMQRLAAP